MMNSPMIEHYATEFAKRLVEADAAIESKLNDGDKQKTEPLVESVFQSILLRNPTEVELESSLNYLRFNSKDSPDIALLAWTDFIKALLSTNEFCFVD